MALPGGQFGFWLRPVDIEPTTDPAWAFADDAIKTWFWREAVVLAGKVWDDARQAGLDRFDAPLIPITDYTRDHRKSVMGTADPDAPPLTPAWDRSRTRSLLRWRVVAGEGAWFWHIHGPQKKVPWGQILYWHSRGEVKGGKVRDVLGFSPRNLAEVKEAMNQWWLARRRRAAQEGGIEPTLRPQDTTLDIEIRGKVLPRSERRERFGDWWKGQTEERVVAQRSVDVLTGPEGSGPGTVGVIFRPPPTRPRRLRLPELVGVD